MINQEQNTHKFKFLGKNSFIAPTVVIRRPHLVSIGNFTNIDHGVYITTAAEIGDYVHISPYITCIGGEKSKLIVEHFATIAVGTRLIAGSDKFLGEGFTGVTVPEEFRDEVVYSTIKISRFCGVGTNVVIMPGVELGEGSVIGACSLVTKNTEPWTIYYGIPARPIKKRKSEKLLEFAKKMGYL